MQEIITRLEIECILNEFEQLGIVRRTGEMRPDDAGKLCPVFVLSENDGGLTSAVRKTVCTTFRLNKEGTKVSNKPAWCSLVRH
jgi:hypothetical protein